MYVVKKFLKIHRMRKLYIVYLYLSVLSSQNLLLKGQFWSVNQSFEGILENKPSIQSQLGYIPTLSLLKPFQMKGH